MGALLTVLQVFCWKVPMQQGSYLSFYCSAACCDFRHSFVTVFSHLKDKGTVMRSPLGKDASKSDFLLPLDYLPAAILFLNYQSLILSSSSISLTF